jgi:hypothetical protein
MSAHAAAYCFASFSSVSNSYLTQMLGQRYELLGWKILENRATAQSEEWLETHTHTHIHIHIDMHMHTHTHTHTLTHTHTNRHTHIQIHIHIIHMNTHTHNYTCAHMHVRTHHNIYIYIHLYDHPAGDKEVVGWGVARGSGAFAVSCEGVDA